MRKLLFVFTLVFSMITSSQSIRVASFNVSMEATNYLQQGQFPTGNELAEKLENGKYLQIKNIAEIIQRTNPDIILLNEFDYSKDLAVLVSNFLSNYLQVPHNNSEPIEFPFFYSAPVNTGVDSGLDLDKDGVTSGIKGDAFGYGLFPGQYGMLVLSKYPIEIEDIRTFQRFLWKDMPNNLMASVIEENGNPYYNKVAQSKLRLSSKSHWDIPIKVNNQILHILASHPTPPVFDGSEDRNGKRNHDEIRFWSDYISDSSMSNYIYDDYGQLGGFKGEHFVVVGDLNASPDEGDGIKSAIKGLLNHSQINNTNEPTSEAGNLNSPENIHAAQHTAEWAMRADYVLPSKRLEIVASGVFWPKDNEPLNRLIKDRKSSSDHRLVWVDVVVK